MRNIRTVYKYLEKKIYHGEKVFTYWAQIEETRNTGWNYRKNHFGTIASKTSWQVISVISKIDSEHKIKQKSTQRGLQEYQQALRAGAVCKKIQSGFNAMVLEYGVPYSWAGSAL